jgi:murein DD-endopeptidase MepM/ murein hydrolase activator NlpD
MEKIKLILLGLWSLFSPLLKAFLYVSYLLFLLILQVLEVIGSIASITMQIVCLQIFNIIFWIFKSIYIIANVIFKAVFFSIREILYFSKLFVKYICIVIYHFAYIFCKNFQKLLYNFIPFLISIPFRIIYLYLCFIDKKKLTNKWFFKSLQEKIKKTISYSYNIFYKEKFLSKIIRFFNLLKKILNTVFTFKIRYFVIKSIKATYYFFKNGILFIYNLIIVLFLLLKSSIFSIISIFKKDFWCKFFKEVYNVSVLVKYIIKLIFLESITLGKYINLFIRNMLLFLWLDVMDFRRMVFYIKNNILKFLSTIIILFFLTYGFVLLFSNPNRYESLSKKWGKSFIMLNTPDILSNVVNSDLFKPVMFYKAEIEVENGSSLYNALINIGIDNNNATNVVATLQKSFDLRKVNPSWVINAIMVSSIEWKLDRVQKLSLPISNKEDLIIEADDNYNYTAYKQEKKLTRYILRRKTLVKDSIYSSAIDSGISPAIAMEVFKVLSWDIDFQRDIKENNSLEVIFECIYNENGDLVTCDNLLFASIIGDKTISFYKFDGGYFHEDGKSVVKTLIKTPVNNARLSSGFGSRKHPVLGFTAFHKGVDFAAPTGTPIYASGDGVVATKYTSATYGNYIKIRHNPNLSSAYAHMNAFAKNIKVGDKVKQWQIIGYVGMTGRVTGPHLHYEVLVNNKQVNPLIIKMPSSMTLSSERMQEFKAYQSTFNTLAVRIPTRGKVVSPIAGGINVEQNISADFSDTK